MPVAVLYDPAEHEGREDDREPDHAPSDSAGVIKANPADCQEKSEEAAALHESWNQGVGRRDLRPEEERRRYSVDDSEHLHTPMPRGAYCEVLGLERIGKWYE